MFTPERMDFVQVLFPQNQLQDVARALVKEGYLQLVDAAAAESWADRLPAPTGVVNSLARQRAEMVKHIVDTLGITPECTYSNSIPDVYDEVMPRFESIEKKVSALSTKLNGIGKQIEDKRALLESSIQISAPGSIPLSKESGNFVSYMYLRVQNQEYTGFMSGIADIPNTMVPLFENRKERGILLVILKKDKEAVQAVMQNFSVTDISAQERGKMMPEDVAEAVISDLVGLELEKTDVSSRLNEIRSREKDFLCSLLYACRYDELCSTIVNRFRKTETTFLVTGWIPTVKRASFESAVLSAARNRCVISFTHAEDVDSVRSGTVDVPVEVNNPGFFKPFEVITKTFGTPSYTSIDPTPALALSFLFMFGLMFGDVGHGAVLALTGLLLRLKSQRMSMKNAGFLLLYAGCASMVFGVLFGSIFGIENWIRPLWLRPMESINDLFAVAIYFGIGMISLAIVFNIINGIREKNISAIFFDKAGLLAGILYWCALAVAMRVLSKEPMPELPFIIPLLMAVSAFLILVHEPVVQLVKGKKKLFPQGVTTGIMGGVIEVLEISLGFLANTVSFIRIAAFGLAHAGLFMAIFSLSDAVHHVAGGAVSVLVLVFGNLGIICLEGLVVSIQAVRLEFYEFFSRFFRESAVVYKPLNQEIQP